MGAAGQAWDYLMLPEVDPERLAELGRQGWELVAVAAGEPERTFYFKRPGLDFRERVTLDQKRRSLAALGRSLPEDEGGGQ